MSVRYGLGLVLLSFAIAVCFLFGTLGWFSIGFGMMTDCTNNYNCTTTGCEPCAHAGRWINAGGIAQWVLAVLGVVVLVRGVRAKRWGQLMFGGAAIVVISVLTLVGTTWRANESFCQPGTPGYQASYCSTDA